MSDDKSQEVEKPLIRRICILSLFAATWIFYSWTARSDGKPFVFDNVTRDYYNMLTDGLQSGRLDLLVAPDPKLLQLSDPYDPEQNAPYRLHDASLYRGKYYLYFGVSPAVFALLPFRLVTGLRLPENFAVAIFLFGGLVFSYLLFRFIIHRFAPATPKYFSYLAIVIFGFCNFAPFILRRPMFYELAIAAGYCFYFTSAYCLITGVLRPQRSYSLLVLGGTTLGLAVGARPNYLFAAIATLSALTYVLLASSGARVAQLKSVLVVMLPFSCVITSLLAYNYVRFDRFSEFGQKYILTGFRPGKFMSSKYFFDNFNAYILSPARIDRHFPFFHLRNQPSPLYSFAYGEPVGGVLPTAPFACAMLGLLPLWKFSRRAHLKDSLGALVLLATLFCLNGSVMVLFL